MAIAALILFFLGSGPVKGFAVVFILGILTTVITAVTHDADDDRRLVPLRGRSHCPFEF